MWLIAVLYHLALGSSARTSLNTRVIGGFEVKGASHEPGDVSLRTREVGHFRHVCGGVLVRPQWVLTAAHCVQESAPQAWEVRVGGVSHGAHKILTRQYNRTTGRNDVALIRLRESSALRVARLPDAEYQPSGMCSVLGYGMTSVNNDTLPSVLHKAMLKVVGRSDCQAALGEHQKLSEDSLCAGGGEVDACQGDSGSPIMCEEDVVVGIVSAGFYHCATPGVPGVYASVMWHRPWIDWAISSFSSSFNKC